MTGLWCPSDPDVSKTRALDPFYEITPPGAVQNYSSYAANRGEFYGNTYYDEASAGSCFNSVRSSMTGVIFDASTIRIADITDGTSNTFLYGEHAHGILSMDDQEYNHWWNSGWWSDNYFDTNYPPNAHRKLAGQIQSGWWWVPLEAASSFHPGGTNFAMCDGTVRFVKDSIATWAVDPNNFGDPVGIGYGNCGEYQIGQAQPKIYQALSTRAGSEIINGNDY